MGTRVAVYRDACIRRNLDRLPKANTNLVDDTKSGWASTPTQPSAYNIEVVVSKHAVQTTTSEQTRFGIITVSNLELIASETQTLPHPKKLSWQTYQSQQQLHYSSVHSTLVDDSKSSWASTPILAFSLVHQLSTEVA